MKKLSLTLAMVTLSLSNAGAANYPIDQGSFALEGSMFIQYQGGDVYENRSGEGLLLINVEPELKYFVSPGVCVGAMFSMRSYSQGNSNADYFLFGPSLGYYGRANPMNENIPGTVYPFFSLFALYGSQTNEITEFSFGGRIGALYMLSDAVGFDFSLKGSFDSYSYYENSQNGYTLTLGVGVMSFIY